MAFNCLSCQVLKRTNSDLSVEVGRAAEINFSYEKLSRARRAHGHRNWSGNLMLVGLGGGPLKPEAHRKQKGNNGCSRLGHRRMRSIGASIEGGETEPRLVRSPGMRRDWSFENLVERG